MDLWYSRGMNDVPDENTEGYWEHINAEIEAEVASIVQIVQKDHLAISKRDAENLLDVLQEWEEVMGAKELSVSDVGLDWERYEEMRARLKKFTGSKIKDLPKDTEDEIK